MSRGVALPPRGSPRDLVLRELLSREYAVRGAEMTLVVRLLSAVAGVDKPHIDKALSAYFDEITHTRYRKAPERAAKGGASKADEDARRLAAVAALNSSTE